MAQTQQIEPAQQPQLAAIFPLNDGKQRYKKINIEWNKIPRANPPDNPTEKTKYINLQAQNILAVVVEKIKKAKDGVFLANHNYISAITKCEKKQNVRIIKQLDNVLDTKFHISIEINGRKKRNYYSFSFKKCRAQEEQKNDHNYKKMSRSDTTTTIYKENNNIEYNRSIKSNISKSNFSNQYDKPKTLAEENLITEEEHSEIVQRSGRDFSLNAMNEILKNMIKRGRKAVFRARKAFKAWFALCIRFELRDAVKTGNSNFYIKSNKTKTEIVEHTTMAEREQFLNKIEDKAMFHRTDETQLKAKWAGTLAINTAYNLLKNLKYWRIMDGIMEIYLQKRMDILEMQKDTLLSQIQAIGAYRKVIEFKLIVENE